jgi:hypothetical protein
VLESGKALGSGVLWVMSKRKKFGTGFSAYDGNFDINVGRAAVQRGVCVDTLLLPHSHNGRCEHCHLLVCDAV